MSSAQEIHSPTNIKLMLSWNLFGSTPGIEPWSFVPVKLNTILGEHPPPPSPFSTDLLKHEKGISSMLVDIDFIDDGADVVGEIIYLPNPDKLMSFLLLTILTGQDHISKVFVLCQVSKSSTMPLIFAKYFI